MPRLRTGLERYERAGPPDLTSVPGPWSIEVSYSAWLSQCNGPRSAACQSQNGSGTVDEPCGRVHLALCSHPVRSPGIHAALPTRPSKPTLVEPPTITLTHTLSQPCRALLRRTSRLQLTSRRRILNVRAQHRRSPAQASLRPSTATSRSRPAQRPTSHPPRPTPSAPVVYTMASSTSLPTHHHTSTRLEVLTLQASDPSPTELECSSTAGQTPNSPQLTVHRLSCTAAQAQGSRE